MNIIEAHNLKCSYTGERIALQVNNLNIPAEKLTFILGVSGVGKSTILETLGLMSNTLVTTPASKFHFNTNGQSINMASLWEKKERIRSQFRAEHLSFIFQSTNLMNNMTVLENAKITQLIQGVPDFKAEQTAKQFLHRIELVERKNGEVLEDSTIELWSKPPQALSGGQRQRLAFARAIATRASILFADEPTGNLDAWNAEKLIQVLTSELEAQRRTGVIVTHDIKLAIDHAHQIVCIRKVASKEGPEMYTHGIVDTEHAFVRTEQGDKWIQKLGDFQNTLTSSELHSFLFSSLEQDILSNSPLQD